MTEINKFLKITLEIENTPEILSVTKIVPLSVILSSKASEVQHWSQQAWNELRKSMSLTEDFDNDN